MKNYADREKCFPPGPKAEADNSLRDLRSGDSCNDALQTSGFEYFYGEKLTISATEIVCC